MTRRGLLTLVLLLALLLPGWAGVVRPAAAAGPLTGTVGWIYDGDTLKVSGIGKVRLVGIDAPEHAASSRDAFYVRRWSIAPSRLRAVSRAAVGYLIDQVKGRTVTLTPADPPRDVYGRLLAYVYLPDHRLLNRILVAKGYASVFRKYDFARKADFFRAERQARRQRLGLWAKEQE